MQFVYDEDSTRFVRNIQAELVRSGGFGYAAGIEEHLARLEELVEESIYDLLNEWQSLLESRQTEAFVTVALVNSPVGDASRNGQIFLRLLERDRSRYEPKVREVFLLTLQLLKAELDTGLVSAPIPLNVVAAVRYLFDVCVLSRRSWAFAQNFFTKTFETSLSIASASGEVIFDKVNTLVSAEAEDAFWSLLERVRQQFGEELVGREAQEAQNARAPLGIDEEASPTDEEFAELLTQSQATFGNQIVQEFTLRQHSVGQDELATLIKN